MIKDRKIYGKWDSAENETIAFEKVKTGEWSFGRFKSWINHVKVIEYREGRMDDSF